MKLSKEFNTRGDFRVECKDGQYYVVGNDLAIPVDSREKGEQFISRTRQWQHANKLLRKLSNK